jgi:hypothetical protein
MANQALERLSALFDSLYANTGRPSIPPEKLLRDRVPRVVAS